MRVCTIAFMCVAAAALPLVGCGGQKSIAGDSPKATAEAFVEAMKAGDYDAIAAGFDYETKAREESTDWDTFGTSQRNLIIQSLQERRESEIEALAGLFTGEASVGQPQQQGGVTIVPVTVGANTLGLQMRAREGTWYLTHIQER